MIIAIWIGLALIVLGIGRCFWLGRMTNKDSHEYDSEMTFFLLLAMAGGVVLIGDLLYWLHQHIFIGWV